MKFFKRADKLLASEQLAASPSLILLSYLVILATVIEGHRLARTTGTSGANHRAAGRGHHRERYAKGARLHARAAAYSDGHSHVNSSESLSSSWYYQRDQPAILDQCCACDEAKYELVFEGLWSKYTHPDDFPENYWLAYFSDIIGASHSNDFQMWAKDSIASDGVRELAEMGSTKKLESELKQVSSKTRTIIKARELRYPTLNSKTSAVFRTDRHHHLVSILSKLGPSPDWMVGVSGLELCQLDCTWVGQRVVNLYLWDAGTDSGSSFTAPDTPSQPQERIHPYQRRGTATAIADSYSNAFNYMQNADTVFAGPLQPGQTQRPAGQATEKQADQAAPMLPPMVDDMVAGPATGSGAPSASGNYRAGSGVQDQVKPFARLTVTRQRIYEKSCNGNGNGGPTGSWPLAGAAGGDDQPTILTRPSSLSQLNQQHHLHPTINSETLIEPISRPNYLDCRFTDWSDWSACSSTCGKGIRTRTRSFLDELARSAGCSQSDLIEKEICLAECVGNTSCVTRDWSEWSKCSVNCGQGYRKRTRAPIGNMRQACATIDLVEMEQCAGDCSELAGGADGAQRSPATGAISSHCAVTEWSQWSECSVACGKGTKIRTRQFVRRDDVDECAHVKLLQKQACSGRPELCKQVSNKNHAQTGQPHQLQQNNHHHNHHHHQQQQQQQQQQHQEQHSNHKQLTNYDLPVIDCKLSHWSPWSTCSALCGNGRRTRSRYVIQMPQNGGKPCDKKLSRTQKCRDLPPCPQEFASQQDPDSDTSAGTNIRPNKAGKPTGLAKMNPTVYRTTTTTTTPGSSMMDDEDDSKFSRSLKAELNHVQLPSWASMTNTYISDGVATSTEMELIGSSSFHIRNGYVYPFSELESPSS